jgi:hypothetical protein
LRIERSWNARLADGQHFVDQRQVGLDVCRHRKGEPRVPPLE